MSQTVNVCTASNEVGNYETKYRLPAAVTVSVEVLNELADLEALGAWVLAHEGEAENVGSGPGRAVLPLVLGSVDDEQWLERAQAATEQVLDAVVGDFLRDPYLHRVEHSLHAWLVGLLVQRPELGAGVTLRTGERTQLVHKEWPETIPGVEGNDRGPRGLFDIAVLSPSQVGAASLDQFSAGRIDAPIVIEVGLDYGLTHLRQDHDKLLHSRVRMPYLLHLSRIAMRDQDETESLLCEPSAPIRTAYVHHDPRTKMARYKSISNASVLST